MNKRQEKKLRDRTFDLLHSISLREKMTPVERKRMLWLLGAWSRLNDTPGIYNYAGDDVYKCMWYVSDRLNSGRARALILLIKNKPFPVKAPDNG